ncbi:MAG: SprT-like domain-containing protein [Thiotrichales bacterium]
MTPPNRHPLTPAQERLIVAETERRIADALVALGLRQGTPLPVRFDVRGTAWGYYVRKRDEVSIRYNPWLFAQFFDDGLRETVPHEVAHYVVDLLHPRPRRRIQPHGREWRAVMRLFGFSDPRTTHRHSLANVPVRRQARFTYRCACRAHELSATRHYRIERSQVIYHCRLCGGPLQADPQD